MKRDRCEVTVYAKIYAHPLEYVFANINASTFKPKAALRRLKINIGQNNEVYLTAYDDLEDAMVEMEAD